MGSEDERVAWLRAQIDGDRGRWFPVVLRYQAFAEGGGVIPSPQMAADLEEAQERLADCAAKLAILDEHLPQDDGMYCRTCVTERYGYPEEWPDDPFPCRTVVSLSRAYRHREGWRQHWGVEAKAAQ